MSKLKVLSVFGTRPEAIKMCPLIKEMEKDKDIESIVCVTAQHREMLDTVLDIFNVIPDYDLNIMAHGQTIVDISTKVLNGVSKVIKDCKPDIVLVHGDTSTTFNGAQASFYEGVPIGHVEAGLRSFDMKSPFPEEFNRVMTGKIATYHFAPTVLNKENLLKDGIKDKVWVTGNTVIDALKGVIDNCYKFNTEILNNIDFDNKKIILLTTHRRENWGEPMINIFKAINQLVKENDDVEVIFPIHKNPYIRDLANDNISSIGEKVHIIEPLEYVEFANLMNKVYLIMTDSGGIQEEAPALGKPVVVLRTETERPEAIDAGTVKLAGIEYENIFNTTDKLIKDNEEYKKMSLSSNPYGDGTSSKKIINILKNDFLYNNK